MSNQPLLTQLPSVHLLLNQAEGQWWQSQVGHEVVLQAVRQQLDQLRQQILHHGRLTLPTPAELWLEISRQLETHLAPTLFPVINATGVIIHTNLGRAPLSQAAQEAIQQVAAGYSNLEYDVPTGQRGSRTVHAEQLLRQVTGGEAALVVNNNAAAVYLLLTELCSGREVIISRGQLVEIGGGFRIPDILTRSGAKLVEVGTTNRTHLRDYAQAITPHTAAILVVHPSNYKMVGFTSEPELKELAQLAHDKGILLLYDQGSGALLDTRPYRLAEEPTVQQGVQAGCDVVAFSGDKLLGGPQAGILTGRAELITRLKKHPLARALRADKLCLAGLAATLTHYVRQEAPQKIPVWQMIARPGEEVTQTAYRWGRELEQAGIANIILPNESTVGGGSLPGTTLPSKVVALTPDQPHLLAEKLRLCTPPVIGRVQEQMFLLDPRTVLPGQEQLLLNSLKNHYPRP